MKSAPSMSLLVLVGLVVPLPSRADEKTEKQVRELVGQFVKAIRAKDVEGILKTTEVPFCEDGKRVIKDRDDLKKLWEKVLKKQDLSDIKLEIQKIGTLEKLEEEAGKKLDEDRRKVLVEVLGKDHRIVMSELEHGEKKQKVAIVVRLDGQKPIIVGVLD